MYDPTIEELEQMWPEMQGQSMMSFGEKRAPRLGEMQSGDIYAEGGNMAPSYSVSPYTKRPDAQSILKDTGFLDAMMQKEEQVRKEHLQKIKDITGVKEVEGEKDIMFPVNPEMAKKFESLADDEKLMIQSVASGKMKPEEYIQKMEEQEKNIMATIQEIVTSKTKGRHALTKDGKEIPQTPENYRGALTGNVEVENYGPYPQRYITEGGGKGGGSGRGGGGGGGTEEPEITTQTNAIVKEQQNLEKQLGGYAKYEYNGETQKNQMVAPYTPETYNQYQTTMNKIGELQLADALQDEFGTEPARKKAKNFLNVDVIRMGKTGANIIAGKDAKGRPVFKLNIDNPGLFQVMQDAIKSGKTAQDVYNFILEDMVKRQSVVPIPGQPQPRGWEPE